MTRASEEPAPLSADRQSRLAARIGRRARRSRPQPVPVDEKAAGYRAVLSLRNGRITGWRTERFFFRRIRPRRALPDSFVPGPNPFRSVKRPQGVGRYSRSETAASPSGGRNDPFPAASARAGLCPIPSLLARGPSGRQWPTQDRPRQPRKSARGLTLLRALRPGHRLIRRISGCGPPLRPR